MNTKKGITISLKSAKIMALIFFIMGTLILLVGFTTSFDESIVVLGFLFIAFAAVFNTVILIILFVDLIKKDQLESFFAICITIVNIPIAIGYFYIITEFTQR